MSVALPQQLAQVEQPRYGGAHVKQARVQAAPDGAKEGARDADVANARGLAVDDSAPAGRVEEPGDVDG